MKRRRWTIGPEIEVVWEPTLWRRQLYLLRSTPRLPFMLYRWVLCVGPISVRCWRSAALRFRKGGWGRNER